ncbi:hypothetical protein JCM3765_000397 [Sporobolomyces pararoseus]
MTPPRLDLSATTTTSTRPPYRNSPSTSSGGRSEVSSSTSMSSSPVSPILKSYSDRVRIARRPSWTPELRIDSSTVQESRPNGLVISSPPKSSHPPFYSSSSSSSSIIMIRPSPIDKEKNDHHSPSFPFPRMNRKLRPQPLSAFSTDTTIRSSTCDSEESLDSNPGSEGSVGGESREGIVESKESLDRIGDSFTSLLSTRRSRMTTTDSFSGEEGEEEAVPQAKVYLRALNGSTAFDNLIISPLTLSNPIDPPSPLSPFGNLALFDALSPLPTPRFDAETAEEVGTFPQPEPAWAPLFNSISTTPNPLKLGSRSTVSPNSTHFKFRFLESLADFLSSSNLFFHIFETFYSSLLPASDN